MADRYIGYYNTDLYLSHHGVKGQQWGERRYQNEDGTLTPEGRIHYGINDTATDIASFAAGNASAHAIKEVMSSIPKTSVLSAANTVGYSIAKKRIHDTRLQAGVGFASGVISGSINSYRRMQDKISMLDDPIYHPESITASLSANSVLKGALKTSIASAGIVVSGAVDDVTLFGKSGEQISSVMGGKIGDTLNSAATKLAGSNGKVSGKLQNAANALDKDHKSLYDTNDSQNIRNKIAGIAGNQAGKVVGSAVTTAVMTAKFNKAKKAKLKELARSADTNYGPKTVSAGSGSKVTFGTNSDGTQSVNLVLSEADKKKMQGMSQDQRDEYKNELIKDARASR